MIKNVLTIDIDFISYDLKKYNDKVMSELTPSQNWQVIRWVTGLKDFRKCDDSLSFIIKTIGQKCKETTFASVTEHHDVIEVLEKYGVKKANLWNIDYHHDLGYDNILGELDCSNWVVYARQNKLISNYTWIGQDDSEFPLASPIHYRYSSYKDLNMEQIPNFDLVVFVTSKWYTPPVLQKYNRLLYSYAISKQNKIGKFMEIPNYKMPKIDLSKYPAYMNNELSDRVFFYDGFFVEMTMIDSIPYLSFINLGEPKSIVNLCKPLLTSLLKQYGTIGFVWYIKGTGIFLKRLTKDVKNKKEFTKGKNNYMILTTK